MLNIHNPFSSLLRAHMLIGVSFGIKRPGSDVCLMWWPKSKYLRLVHFWTLKGFMVSTGVIKHYTTNILFCLMWKPLICWCASPTLCTLRCTHALLLCFPLTGDFAKARHYGWVTASFLFHTQKHCMTLRISAGRNNSGYSVCLWLDMEWGDHCADCSTGCSVAWRCSERHANSEKQSYLLTHTAFCINQNIFFVQNTQAHKISNVEFKELFEL